MNFVSHFLQLLDVLRAQHPSPLHSGGVGGPCHHVSYQSPMGQPPFTRFRAPQKISKNFEIFQNRSPISKRSVYGLNTPLKPFLKSVFNNGAVFWHGSCFTYFGMFCALVPSDSTDPARCQAQNESSRLKCRDCRYHHIEHLFAHDRVVNNPIGYAIRANLDGKPNGISDVHLSQTSLPTTDRTGGLISGRRLLT